MRTVFACLAALALGSASMGWTQTPASIDPLTAKVDDSAAQRFAKLWRETNGKPTAAQLKSQYLDNGGRGIEVFTPNRIRNAEWLAKTIADNPQLYREAVERCLPWVAPTNAELRATYLGLRGLLPTRDLPEIAVVIGANNSGGTAGTGIQVIGLEVICRLSRDEAAFSAYMRQFFAHETVHTWQNQPAIDRSNPLLAAAFAEGVPDLITKIVTASAPQAERDRWALTREAEIWTEFQADATVVRAGTDRDGRMNEVAETAFKRWFRNANQTPGPRPSELGYWVGMRIGEAYLAVSTDQHRAMDELIEAKSPTSILKASGYEAKFTK